MSDPVDPKREERIEALSRILFGIINANAPIFGEALDRAEQKYIEYVTQGQP